MSITERLMAIGSFAIRLKPSTPRYILDEVDITTRAFSRVAVTATKIDPTYLLGASADTIAGLARYVGVLRQNSDGYTVAGNHQSVLLGDEQGLGPQMLSNYDGNLGYLTTGWLSALLDSTTPNGFSRGATDDTGVTEVFITTYLDTVRKGLDFFCAQSGAEYRVNNDRTVDLKAPDLLWQWTPTIMAMRGADGRDPNLIGLKTVSLGQSQSVADYATHVYIIARGDGGYSLADYTNPTTSYYAPDGVAIDLTRVVDGANVKSTDAAAAAQYAAEQFGSIRRSILLTVDDPDIRAKIAPGDNISVYDPESLSVFNAAGYKQYRGRDTYPITSRCVGMTYPVTGDYGVYLLTSEATTRIIDLTPYVVAETGEVTLELGAPTLRVSASPQFKALTTGSVTGSQPTSLLSGYTDLSSTQTITNWTKGNGTISSFWRYIDPKTVRFYGNTQMGTTSSVGGVLSIPLPVNAATNRWHTGSAKAEGGSSSRTVGVAEINTAVFGNVVHFASNGNAGWDASTPFAWTSGNVLAWDITYEVA